MGEAHFIGIDTGTYESKGVIVDGRCRVVAQASVAHGLENPRPGFFEHDAEAVWWHDFREVSRALLRKSGLDPRDIRAIGASALGADCLPVDRDCRPLRKAILYGIDARAVEEMAWLTGHWGEERIKAWFGRPLCSSDVMPKILWLKNHEPEIHAAAHKFLTGSSYITAKLTGRYVVDRFLGLASFNPLYDRDGSPNPLHCDPVCRPDQLAEVLGTIEIAGCLGREAAAETGLAEGTPVIVGTDDSGAEAISTGVLRPGDMMLQLGSTLYMILCTDRLVDDDRVWREEFIIPGTFDISAGTNAAGTLTRWYRDQLFPECVAAEKAGGPNAYAAMMEGIEEIPPGSEGLVTLPYVAGERTPINDPLARGAILGLGLRHTRRHLYRSALESVGYSINQHFAIFAEQGVAPRRVMATGGGTKNPAWLQMIADITGKAVSTAAVTLGASYGDAMMAAMGIGHFANYAELASLIRPGRSFEPDPRRHEAYRRYQEIFDSLYPATRELMHRL
ncbi:MAG TPA: FGGY-family carbohydrate kinase [Spirochaetales bacterium]|nr:FGGY-family carbohydrate kinase [Spirochaetales bacterium]HRY55300.1 FGGY-family carbohydrate kinase [Spirochaetia bacterium]HRZ64344.1 FGGY-family carbohydrate kinase [Spirochaetia bacterium]